MFPLYRGQRSDNKEWLVGNLVVCKPYDLRKWGINLVEPLRTYIRSLNIEWDNKGRCYRWKEYEVSPESLSMFTNQTDKNNIAIFGSFEIDERITRGGDRVRTNNHKGIHYFDIFYTVDYCGALGAFTFEPRGETVSSVHCEASECCEIIGKQMDFKE